MKNLMAGLLVAVVLMPAAEVSQKELERGRDEMLTTAQTKITDAAAKNRKHVWMKLDGYNFSQKYAVQREIEKKGYQFETALIGSTFIGW